MNQPTFSKNDIDQIKKSGLDLDIVYSQFAFFYRGTPFANLARPCTVGDGIKKLSPDRIKQCIYLYETQGIKKKLIKFVPASGAATRMFKKLIHAYQESSCSPQRPEDTGSRTGSDLRVFIDNCRRFAFYDKLKTSMTNAGLDIELLVAAKDSKQILQHLLEEKYLNFAQLPKGLINFHSYDHHTRTAFEEHFVEAGGYVRTDSNDCVLHFTVSSLHEKKFRLALKKIQPVYEKKLDTRFNVSFSIQEPHTNTIAADSQNRPFRLSDGSLLFRPGGHGALINNLNRLDGDIVFIKNIDNVAHDRFISETIEWKKILCGYLILLQNKIFNFLDQLHGKPATDALILEAAGFIETELSCQLPKEFDASQAAEKLKILTGILDRPLRVCGMVKNSGQPGGGPFWVKDAENHISVQIIEKAQIDTKDKDQKSILNQLTHFNPVDLVCGIRNWRGELFNLSEYVDHQAVFISKKSKNGRELKALELPGLWNGAMAFWNTAFVEVPKITFNPVKEVSDLLDMHHQPAS